MIFSLSSLSYEAFHTSTCISNQRVIPYRNMQNEKTNWVTQKRKADADIETTTKSCCGFSPLCEKIGKFVPKSFFIFDCKLDFEKTQEKS